MYKNIIPKLVSLDTDLKKIKGFGFSENLDFYNNIHEENKFYYKVLIDDNIKIPSKYDFRGGYYFKFNGSWCYERKIFKNISLKFKYDVKNKTFIFNKAYSIIPFEIGGILPVGKHIADLINLELFLNDYIIFRGCAVQHREKNICIIAPSFNGKTNFVRQVLEKKGKYISEDILVLNFKNNTVTTTSFSVNNFGRFINGKLASKVNLDNILVGNFQIDKLYLVQNYTKPEYELRNKKLFEYLFINSLFFMNNDFIKSYIFEKNLINKINDIVLNIRSNKNINYEFVGIKDFNFNLLIKK